MNGQRPHLAVLCLALLLAGPVRASAEETIELIPDDRAGFSAAHLFAPITGFFLGGPGYWYGDRHLDIETVPPGAILDLFYVRSNFQKAYEQAEAPVKVLLPPRIQAGPRDSVTVRALLDGYRQQEVSVRVRSRDEKVEIQLDPLPNSLLAVTHVYFADRASLSFLTEEALTFRLQKADDGFTVVLTQTGLSSDARGGLEGVHGALVESLTPQQLGEDLVVRVALSDRARESGVETRSRQSVDAVRGLHSFSLDLVPADGGAAAVARAKAALARIGSGALGACAGAYDEALREQLDPAALARALAPRGSFTDPYLRAALRRLGEVAPDGMIRTTDGARYDPDRPIELSAAATQAADALGYLALLRSFVAELEPEPYRRETLRGLIAPEVGTSRFDSIVETAETREQRCLASR